MDIKEWINYLDRGFNLLKESTVVDDLFNLKYNPKLTLGNHGKWDNPDSELYILRRHLNKDKVYDDGHLIVFKPTVEQKNGGFSGKMIYVPTSTRKKIRVKAGSTNDLKQWIAIPSGKEPKELMSV